MTLSITTRPFVTVLTPVYNGAAYLRECIESVLRQTFSNFEYIIINNCSTDGTLEIAQEYAAQDQRIHVHSNQVLLDVITNHNRAFALMSPKSKYCKVVSGDDWLYPECLERMVALAEANPSVGFVGSYQLSGRENKWYIRATGLPYYTTVVLGREICRAHLLGKLSVFGAPTSNMYRADLVRSSDAFFPNLTAEADISAFFKHLTNADFGFVHQVLSYERLHEATQTAVSRDLNAYMPSKLSDLLSYGSFYLTTAELNTRLKEFMNEYYAFLAVSAVNFRNKKFWQYHRRRLKELGYPLQGLKLTKAVLVKLTDMFLNIKQTIEKIIRRKFSSLLAEG